MKKVFIIFYIFMTAGDAWATKNANKFDKNYSHLGFVPKATFIIGRRTVIDLGIYRINYRFASRVVDRGKLDKRESPSFKNMSYFATLMHGFYLSTEIYRYLDKTKFAPKIGYEFSQIAPTFATTLGMEIKYYTDNVLDHSIAIAPKIGIPFKFFNFFYSYNWISNQKYNSIVGRHQLQITYNFSFKGLEVLNNMLKEWTDSLNEIESQNQL